jgi:hypothetical protein
MSREPKQSHGVLVRDNVCESKKLDAVSDGAQALWFRLLTKADDYGNYYADPQFIKTGCFPLKPKMRLDRISNLIEELVSVGLLIPYEADGRKLFHITKFEDHQPRNLVHKAARFPNFRAETRTEVKLSGANQQLSPDHAQLTTSVINKIDPCVSDSVCVGVSGKPKPPLSVRETQEETRVQMDWPRWINHPVQIGAADPFEVQRVVWWHWCCNPRRFWRDKIKTVADLLAHFGQMQKECPDFKQQYAVLAPGLDPERPYGEMLTARCPDEH